MKENLMDIFTPLVFLMVGWLVGSGKLGTLIDEFLVERHRRNQQDKK